MEHNQRFDQCKKGLDNTIIFIKHNKLCKTFNTFFKKHGCAAAKLNKEIKMGLLALRYIWKQKISVKTLVIQATELSPLLILHKIGDFQVNCSTILQAPLKQYNMEMR